MQRDEPMSCSRLQTRPTNATDNEGDVPLRFGSAASRTPSGNVLTTEQQDLLLGLVKATVTPLAEFVAQHVVDTQAKFGDGGCATGVHFIWKRPA